MKDSILKGTGNSRFLKSAIPDGTTWAEALAMLRAGTFPMDLNGINSAGFQQVGTPLNKANLLKDVNALTLGLTGDAVPNDMFNVLAHAGDLHVWKKTTNGVVTYPVSTNPNAYQEGDDAKEAGYTLGDVVMGDYRFVNDSSATVTIYYADAPIVSDDGRTVDIAKNNGIPMKAAYSVSDIKAIKGKYIQIADSQKDYAGTPFNDGRVYYIPSNEMFSMSSGLYAATDRYQPVTGYAAIPARTTIEYLGKLGDKARVQVVSYVGTGTYGSSNPNSLTFDFVPKLLFVLMKASTLTSDGPHPYATGWVNMFMWAYGVSNTFVNRDTLYLNQNNKTISWYSGVNSECQCNWKNIAYVAIAIG